MPPTDQEIRELQASYLDSTVETLGTLRDHVEALPRSGQFKTSFPLLLFIAHQLKGSGGTLGFRTISDRAGDLASELETFLDDAAGRPDPDELARRANKILERLEDTVHNIRSEFDQSAIA